MALGQKKTQETNMINAWMIRAGEGGHLAEKFAKGHVAIGWHELGDLTKAQTDDEIREKYLATRLEDKKGAASNAVAMLYKFRRRSALSSDRPIHASQSPHDLWQISLQGVHLRPHESSKRLS